MYNIFLIFKKILEQILCCYFITFRQIKTLIIVCSGLFFITLPAASIAATYYIDYYSGSDLNSGTAKVAPWKRCPGMVGFSGSYSHSAGDIFIFKGGVTWPASTLPLAIDYSGSSGKVDQYTTDQTWYDGGSWSQPTFNGGGNKSSGLITANGKSYFKLNDISIIGVYVANASDSYKAVTLADCEKFEVSYMTFAPECWIALYTYSDSSSKSGYSIHHNDISHCGMGIVVAVASSNTVISDVYIYNNNIHDFHSKLVGSTHGDGIHTWGTTDNTGYIDEMKIYNNKFYGSWEPQEGCTGTTGQIYVEDRADDTYIYNNSCTYSGTPTSNWFTSLIRIKLNSGTSGGVKVFNNSLRGTDPGMSSGIELYNCPNSYVRNNIVVGMRYPIAVYSGSISGTTIDYNCLYPSGSSVGYWDDGFKTWSQWNDLGLDTRGKNLDPLYSSSFNLRLQADSPCINEGLNLEIYTSIDLDGKLRAVVWDMGAYEFSGDTPDSLSPPMNLKIALE